MAKERLSKKELEWLIEGLKTARNQAEIALVILVNKRTDLIFTELECLYETVQKILDTYCIKEGE